MSAFDEARIVSPDLWLFPSTDEAIEELERYFWNVAIAHAAKVVRDMPYTDCMSVISAAIEKEKV